jgi:hypothetical protein
MVSATDLLIGLTTIFIEWHHVLLRALAWNNGPALPCGSMRSASNSRNYRRTADRHHKYQSLTEHRDADARISEIGSSSTRFQPRSGTGSPIVGTSPHLDRSGGNS